MIGPEQIQFKLGGGYMGIYSTTFAYDWGSPQFSDKENGKITTRVSGHGMYNFPAIKGRRN